MDRRIEETVKKSADGGVLSDDELRRLFSLACHSVEAGYVMAAAGGLSRQASGNKAEVHAQMGLNVAPCPNDCAFCAFAACNGVFTEEKELAPEEAVEMALAFEADDANAIFLMSTADHPFARFIEMAQEVRSHLKPETVMIANVGDFTVAQGQQLRDAGFTGVYHALRMGEGQVTRLDPERRVATFRAAHEVGLALGTCVEPVGPEHSIDELVEKTIVGRDSKPCYSGTARRITVPGSSLEKYGMITEYKMAYLVAVVRLAMGPSVIGNCTHEPNTPGAMAGANLFWAEVGSNPRDTEEETGEGRGLTVTQCKRLFEEADYEVLEGPSVIYNGRS